jgi:tetratricopeptide (TPR) repeat protein
MLAVSQLEPRSNSIAEPRGPAVSLPDPNDPVEKDFQKLMSEDDDAQSEVDKWIRENQAFGEKGGAVPAAELKRRIERRLDPVQQHYEEFLKQHPRHSRARVAYASFLGDIKGEEAAQEQLEKALEVDTNNPAIYNNLANIYGHIGPVKKAFEFYARAVELNPVEPIYYHNFGDTVYLFRKDAMEYYKLNEQQVFAKAFNLFSNAMRLDPDNFPLATDVAQSWYGVQPLPTEQALKAWTNALHIAHDEVEREGVYVHFARVKLLAGRFTEARAHLNAVTNEMYGNLKARVLRNLNERENEAKTNSLPKPQEKN